MHLDHLSYAANPDGLAASAARLADILGAEFTDGGVHPRFGTRNMTLPLADGRYLELVEVLEHPAAEKAPFGQAVRARSEAGGGWMAWVLAVDDLSPYEERLGRKAADGTRTLPTGVRLEWKQLGIKGLLADPQLPFFVHWEGDGPVHGTEKPCDLTLKRIVLAGDPERVTDWLGGEVADVVDDGLEIEWAAPHGNPGLIAAVFDSPRGEIRL